MKENFRLLFAGKRILSSEVIVLVCLRFTICPGLRHTSAKDLTCVNVKVVYVGDVQLLSQKLIYLFALFISGCRLRLSIILEAKVSWLSVDIHYDFKYRT